MNKNRFSLVLPVLNEEKNINKLILLLKKYLLGIPYELIFVDDNSLDKTAFIIKKHTKKNIKYFLRLDEPDLSQACIFGINKSKYNNIIIMDSDLQHNPKYLPRMISLFSKKKYDFLIGTRNFSFDGSLVFYRFILSKLLIYIFNIFLRPSLNDPMSGFFIFKKKIYKKNKNQMFGKGFKILSDLIYNKNNYYIGEFVIKFNSRKKNKSKMSLAVLLNVVKLLIFKIYLLYICK
jgi:dolichol-phosphate mannosyltransferase